MLIGASIAGHTRASIQDPGRADKRSQERQEIAEGVWCCAPASSDSLDWNLAYRVVRPGRRDLDARAVLQSQDPVRRIPFVAGVDDCEPLSEERVGWVGDADLRRSITKSMGILVGIISNAFPSALKILEESGLIQKFKRQHVILSYEYNSVKPERAIYKQAVKKAKAATERLGGYLSAVASVVGAPGDPQNLRSQREQLERAGVLVMGSNAQAAEVATNIATRGKVRK